MKLFVNFGNIDTLVEKFILVEPFSGDFDGFIQHTGIKN